MKKIGIIGFGNLGSAIAVGLKDQGFQVGISEEKRERAEAASRDHGIQVYSEKKDLLENSEMTIIAVKPQELDPLLDELDGIAENGELISVIAGRKMSYIADRLKPRSMARFMPNLAAKVSKALVGVAFGPGVREEFKTDCLEVAKAIGTPCEVPESLMPAITGLSGSGIAYVFSFIHAMALGGVKTGIAYPLAVEMAVSIIEGGLEVVRESGENPTEWLNRVISPAGTTIQGVAALEENGFTAAVMEAVERATDRAKELEG
jgi:pyrroline-5-carboxylate reductase